MKELIIGKIVKKVVLLDDEDYEEISQYSWGAKKDGNTYYAYRYVHENGKVVKRIRMHRQILNFQEYDGHTLVDHRNGNGLDNRRSNLRICTRAENAWNSSKPKANTSGYKGAYTVSGCENRWRSQIKVNNRLYYLGVFGSPEEAHEAYCQAGRELHKEYFNSGKKKRRRRKKY